MRRLPIRRLQPGGGVLPLHPGPRRRAPATHLSECRGILQADGYAGFAKLYGGNRVIEAACLAHARRKIWNVQEATKSPLTREVLNRIGTLYRVNDTIRGRPPNHRLAVRVAHTVPLMGDLRSWLDATLSRISGRSDLIKGFRYALSRWDALTLILRDRRAYIDNSAADKAMRPIAIGKRN